MNPNPLGFSELKQNVTVGVNYEGVADIGKPSEIILEIS
jgi:hypothetical protein